MPKLTIVIGANGAGKSTWCDRHRNELPANFYDADSIAKGLGDWNSADKQRQAREVVDKAVEEHLTARTDFGFESTYSGRSRPRIVRRAKAAGYEPRRDVGDHVQPPAPAARPAKPALKGPAASVRRGFSPFRVDVCR